MIQIESIPENLTFLRNAVAAWLSDQQNRDILDEFNSTLKTFASSYDIDLNNMTHEDMILLNNHS